MSQWRDETRIPRGMSHFTRWYRPPGIPDFKHPADIDGILHTVKGNKFWMFEFKPLGARVTTGQDITLRGFSQLPKCQATVIFDPYSQTEDGRTYADDLTLDAYMYWKGDKRKVSFTVQELNNRISEWFA